MFTLLHLQPFSFFYTPYCPILLISIINFHVSGSYFRLCTIDILFREDWANITWSGVYFRLIFGDNIKTHLWRRYARVANSNYYYFCASCVSVYKKVYILYIYPLSITISGDDLLTASRVVLCTTQLVDLIWLK